MTASQSSPTWHSVEAYENLGYTCVKEVSPGEFVGIMPFLFTHAIVSGLNQNGYSDRWCYHSFADAYRALEAWDGEGEPDGWHRHPLSGRRRDKQGNLFVAP